MIRKFGFEMLISIFYVEKDFFIPISIFGAELLKIWAKISFKNGINDNKIQISNAHISLNIENCLSFS